MMNFLGVLMRVLYIFDTRLYKETLTWVELILSISLNLYIIRQFYNPKITQSDHYHQYSTWKIIVPACIILSFFFHPGEKNEYYFTLQMFVSCSMFIEACSLLPQILLSKKEGFIDHKVGQYLVFIAISRGLRLVFWVLQYLDGDQFIYLILADVVHSIIIADFVWLYFKHKGTGAIPLPN